MMDCYCGSFWVLFWAFVLLTCAFGLLLRAWFVMAAVARNRWRRIEELERTLEDTIEAFHAANDVVEILFDICNNCPKCREKTKDGATIAVDWIRIFKGPGDRILPTSRACVAEGGGI